MINKKVATKFSKIYYGWIIVFVCALSYFFSAPGQSFSISSFIDAYIKEFGYSRTGISSIYSLATVLSGCLIIFVGKAIDQYGQRKMYIICGLMLAFACFFSSFIINLPMLFISFFLLRYFGQGSMTLIPKSLIPQWFDKSRALTLSLITFGISLANIVVPVINARLINNYGFQKAWLFWGTLLIIFVVPILYIFTVNSPEEIGLLPDNEKIDAQTSVEINLEDIKKSSYTLIEAMKTKEFYILGLICMVAPMITTGIMFHFYSLMSLKNIDANSAAFVIGLIAYPTIIIPFVSHYIIDRKDPKKIILTTLVFISLSTMLLIFSNNIYTTGLFMLFYGFITNIQNITLGVLWPKFYGRGYLGSIKGAATVFTVVGSALGPIPFGLCFDVTGQYNIILVIVSISTLFIALLSTMLKKPKSKN